MEKLHKIKKSKQGGFVIFSVTDALVGETASDFQNLFSESLEKGEAKIILDLSLVPFIDSMSLEMIQEMHKESQKKNGGMKIANPSEICTDIFYSTRMANSLDIYPDVESARRSFL